jgi:hypothetical protein
MCKCRRYEYLGVTEKGRWFHIREQRPVAKRTCRLPSSGRRLGGLKRISNERGEGGRGGNHGRKEG